MAIPTEGQVEGLVLKGIKSDAPQPVSGMIVTSLTNTVFQGQFSRAFRASIGSVGTQAAQASAGSVATSAFINFQPAYAGTAGVGSEGSVANGNVIYNSSGSVAATVSSASIASQSSIAFAASQGSDFITRISQAAIPAIAAQSSHGTVNNYDTGTKAVQVSQSALASIGSVASIAKVLNIASGASIGSIASFSGNDFIDLTEHTI